jgi:hypothetical protein
MALFKPGQSGNPKGRPKGAHNIAQEFLAEVEQAAPGDAPVSKLRAMIKAQVDKAMQGDNRAIEAVLGRVEELAAKMTAAADRAPAFTAADRETIEEIHRRLASPPHAKLLGVSSDAE